MNINRIDEKLVTIGILCFNAENSISEVIKNAFEQTWNNKEIIIIDDFSNDNSYEEIKKSKYFDEIKYLRNSSNMGPAYSRNQVLKNSNGDFICFMDDDDFSDKSRIVCQINSIYDEGYPFRKEIISICGVNRKYSSGYIKKMRPIGSIGKAPQGDSYINYVLFNQKEKDIDYGFGMPTCAMLLTKECFQKVGLFDENLRRVEDLDITIRFAKRNFLFIGLDEFLVIQNSTSGFDKTPLVNLKSEIMLIKKNKEYLSKKGLFMYSRLWPLLRYYHFQRNYIFLILILFIILLRYPFRAMPHFIKSTRNRIIHELNIFNGKKFFFNEK